jgi:hypothetical protein
MPILENTDDKPIEVETDGKKTVLQPGQEVAIKSIVNLKVSGSYVLR